MICTDLCYACIYVFLVIYLKVNKRYDTSHQIHKLACVHISPFSYVTIITSSTLKKINSNFPI